MGVGRSCVLFEVIRCFCGLILISLYCKIVVAGFVLSWRGLGQGFVRFEVLVEGVRRLFGV